ncbi:MAG: GGDEF domain-containing protein [Firmicutes bacterium]|nr:GGDEF domain-containing protein [Bacillota bacterium]
MFNVRKLNSTAVFFITIILIIFIGIGDLYSGYINYSLLNEADLINRLGVIRGSIQRLLKLELIGVENAELLSSIDASLQDLRFEQNNPALTELRLQWEQIKQTILQHRSSPSGNLQHSLLSASEQIWDTANSAVLSIQNLSEQRLTQSKLLFALTFSTLMLAAVILVWLRRYVQGQLEYLVRYDTLTSAITRSYYEKILPREMEHARRNNSPLSLIVLDVDKFKQINDTHGHIVGDYALQKLAAILINNLRRTDFLARIGGDEFVIIAPQTTKTEAKKLADRLQRIIADTDFPGLGPISISMGIAQFDFKESMNQLVDRADQALYQAKADGRNQTAVSF